MLGIFLNFLRGLAFLMRACSCFGRAFPLRAVTEAGLLVQSQVRAQRQRARPSGRAGAGGGVAGPEEVQRHGQKDYRIHLGPVPN